VLRSKGDRAALEKLAQAGAKVVRVYRESDVWVLDEAQRLGMKVVLGCGSAIRATVSGSTTSGRCVRRKRRCVTS
jgi:hypothetical protein